MQYTHNWSSTGDDGGMFIVRPGCITARHPAQLHHLLLRSSRFVRLAMPGPDDTDAIVRFITPLWYTRSLGSVMYKISIKTLD